MRTSVMTHLAWVPSDWEEAAVETLAGLGERHPSRGILLFPEPDGDDGIDAKVSMLAFPLREQRRHIAAEVVELRLRGQSSRAAASIVNPLLIPGLPVFLRWRGRPAFGEPAAEQLIEVCDRLIYDSKEWPDVPQAYTELPFDQAACSDIAWRRTEPWRGALAGLWPAIGEIRRLRVDGPLAEATLLVGWLRSRLEREVELEHDESEELSEIEADGTACAVPEEHPSSSELLSAELDEFARDRVYEAAASRAVG
jgi:glucose-6-phosphate dehydrogenase assembly protein OpcA